MERSSFLVQKGIDHGFFNRHDSSELKNPVTLNQIHSFKVVQIDSLGQTLPPADAMVTKVKGIPLTLKTADCAPVLLADAQNGIIGAAHAGWKGAVKGVTDQTLLAMVRLGAKLENITAAIGPCIHEESYPVSESMKVLFSTDEAPFFKSYPDSEHFNLPAYVAYRLSSAGVQTIETLNIDTYPNADYNSYRRDSQNPARQFSSIWLTN
ncbi:MAG: peptidoglycan editing factor PgeF [Sphingobacteriia bacterium]|nr:peptidoglycan editing factor PgeF [Sphingobacteriia bacterium]